MIIVRVVGLVFGAFAWNVPPALMIGLKMLGDATLPMMLFALGARLTDLSRRGWQVGVLGAVVCPVAGVAGAYLAQIARHLPAEQFAHLMLFPTLPPPALNYLLPEPLQREPGPVACLGLMG